MFSTGRHYWGHIVNPPVPFGVKTHHAVVVELMAGISTKPFALIIRLFANMISGHIIILSFISLIFYIRRHEHCPWLGNLTLLRSAGDLHLFH